MLFICRINGCPSLKRWLWCLQSWCSSAEIPPSLLWSWSKVQLSAAFLIQLTAASWSCPHCPTAPIQPQTTHPALRFSGNTGDSGYSPSLKSHPITPPCHVLDGCATKHSELHQEPRESCTWKSICTLITFSWPSLLLYFPHDRGKHSQLFLYSFVLSQTSSALISSGRWPRATTEHQMLILSIHPWRMHLGKAESHV